MTHFARFAVTLLAALALGGKALAFDSAASGAAQAETTTRTEKPPAHTPGDHARGLYGWYGFDIDNSGPQLWFGASHAVAGPLALAATVWAGLGFGTQHTLGEFAIGPELNIAGALFITLQLGVGFDFDARELQYLSAPQLFVTLDLDPIYFEAWNFVYFYETFYGAYDRPAESVPPAGAYVGRYMLLYEFTPTFALGPQLELAVNFKHATINGLETVSSMPLGVRLRVGYGPEATLGWFVAYETRGDEMTPANRVVGRFTYVHSF